MTAPAPGCAAPSVAAAAAVDATAVVDRSGRIRAMSPQYARLLGVSAAAVAGALLTGWLHPDDGPLVALALAAGEGQAAARRAVGSGWVWCVLRIAAAGDGLLQVTSIERAAAPARRSLSAAVDALGTGIVVVAADGTVTAANSAASRIFAAAGRDLLGTRLAELDCPVERSRLTAVPEELCHLVGPDGSRTWIASTWQPGPDGVVVGTLRDVTAEQRVLDELAAARDEIAARERRLASLIANSAETTAVTDAGGVITWVAAGVRRHGLDPAELVGTSCLASLHPDDEVTGRMLLRDAGTTPGESWTRQRLRWRAREGAEWRFCDVTMTNLLHDPAVGGFVINMRDVTEQVHTEAALRRQDLMFRALLTQASDELRVFTADGTLRYASPSARARTGASTTLEDIHPDDREAMRAVFTRVASRPGGGDELVYRVPGPDGTTRWMESRFANLLDDPAIRGVVLTTREVSFRQREAVLVAGQQAALEAASAEAPLGDILSGLCATVERYLAPSAGTAACMTLLSNDGRFEGPFEPVVVGYGDGGALLADRSGYHADRTPPKLTGRFAGPIADSPMLRPVADRAMAGGLRWMWRTGVGGERTEPLGTLVVAVAADRGPEPHEQEMLDRIADLMWALATRDRARKSVAHSERRFRVAFAHTGVPTAWLSLDGRFEEVNPAMVELFGYPAEQLAGEHVRTLMADPDRCRPLPPIEGDTRPPQEKLMRRADGQTLQVVAHLTVIRDADGVPTRLVAHYVDVTALRAGEEEVRLLNELLHTRIAELDTARDRLAAAFRQVSQAREAERKSLALALHDDTVQQLLATLWSLDFLDLDEDDENLAELRRQMQTSIESVRKMIFELRPPILDVAGLPGAAEQELEKLHADTGAAVTLDSALTERLPSEVETMAYRTLREALQNVRKHARAAAVTVRLALRAGGLAVQVVDDGVGFDPAQAESRRAAGHLGVASIRESITLSGGEVYLGVRRDGQRGTELALELPLVAGGGDVVVGSVTGATV